MSFQNRQYFNMSGGFGSGYGRGLSLLNLLGLPPMTPMVKKLMLANGVVFLAQMISYDLLVEWFAATGATWTLALQIWRVLSFQFLHGGFMHILGNMLGLYFFGTTIENLWGSKRFLWFYFTCGTIGGVLYVIFCRLEFFDGAPLIGASGGVLGLMMACAILFPQMKIFLFPIPLPVPIRVMALFIAIGYVLNVLSRGANAGGDLCHLGGIFTALTWVLGQPWWSKFIQLHQKSNWQRQQQDREKLQFEVDRILSKVHEEGLQSLTQKEKDLLQKATAEQARNAAR